MKTIDIIGDSLIAYGGARVVVLGASGFIGRWLARKLTQLDADLFLPVRESSAARSVFEEYGVKGKVSRLDLLSANGLAELIGQIEPAVVFDLAGYGVDRDEGSEDIAYQINAGLPERICSAVAKSNDLNWRGQNIVRAGSAMEYGSATGDLEETSAARPTTLYGRSKLAGTLNLAHSCERLGLKGMTARLFSVYGPGEHPGRLLPTLLRARATGDSIKLTAGNHKRDFIYVEDAAEGLLRLGLAPENSGGIVNLATGILTPVRIFAETAADELGLARERLVFGALPTRAEEMEHEPTSIARLGELTGWCPRMTIAEGVRKTLALA